MRSESKLTTLLSASGANGWSAVFPVNDYRIVQIVISTASNASGTIKVAGSMLSGDDVDYTASAEPGNEWDNIALYDLQDPSSIIAGDTGVVYAGTDAVRQLKVNVDAMKNIAVNLSGYAAGSFTVKAIGYSEEYGV